ncbi:nacht wd domain-containing protein [Fusarium mundagurra]|uniref:Nacht wd domain-containing protein n=1 Tax=Fusarium mundagurra TaxID=1567541 RepID=A0A8H5Y327_9HYPO|nr:nacht wd domain-containing protein [Fusarium mundagurra]
MCLGSFQFWRKGRKKPNQSPEDSGPARPTDICSNRADVLDSSQSAPQRKVPISPLPKDTASAIGSTASVPTGLPSLTNDTHLAITPDGCNISTPAVDSNKEPTAAILPPQSSPKQSQPQKLKVQEHLWDRAYNEFKSKNKELFENYTKLLSAKGVDIGGILNQDSQSSITTSTQDKWDQMKKFAEAELERTEKSADVQEMINNGIETALPIKKMVDQIMPVVPHAQVPWLVVSLTFEIFSNPFKEPGINRTGLLYVMSKMEWYMNLADHLIDDGGPQLQEQLHSQLKEHTVELYEKLLFYQIKSICCFNKHFMNRFCRDILKVDDWSSKIDEIKKAEAVVCDDVNAFQNQVMVDNLREQSSSAKLSLEKLMEISLLFQQRIQEQRERRDGEDNRKCRQHLFKTNPIDDKERILHAKGALVRDSYSWVVDHPQFLAWQRNAQHRLLWIRGDAGKGKTMMLCGIIEELQKDPFCRLCYFFCQATDESLRDAKHVLRGLLSYLIKQYPWLISYVRKDYDDSGEKLFEDHNAWEALCRIFKSALADERFHEVIIIIDALDECVVQREKLLEFICDISAGSRAKLLVSSRPWPSIEKMLRGDGERSTTLALEQNDTHISLAVKCFIERRVEDLAKHPPYEDDPDICEEIRVHLTKNAEGTFLWVALVCKELSSNNVERATHVRDILKDSPPGLDKLYDRMLVSLRESRDFALCTEILAATSVVKRHVTLEELLSIIDPAISSEIDLADLEKVIVSCGSFLYLQKGVVKFIHQSAVDYLLSEDTSSKLPSIPDRHHSLFSNGLCVLQTSAALKRDIYGLEAPDVTKGEISKPRPDPLSPLAYSCIHWVDHLYNSIFPEETVQTPASIRSEDTSAVTTFLESKFLFWIEALSLLGQVHSGVQAIQKLHRVLSGESSQGQQPLSEFVQDANLFLLHHKSLIKSRPLQLYNSCLIFSPEQSIVKSQFKSEAPGGSTVAPGLESQWDACLQTLDEHEAKVEQLAYSPDGQWFVSASRDGSVKIWHADSGYCIRTVDGHGKGYQEDQYSIGVDTVANRAVAFTTDGESVVLGVCNGSVKVWDRATGNLSSEYQAHQSHAKVMAVSSDGCTFAYFLREGSIRIWSTNTKIPSRSFSFPETHDLSVALSANGEWLVATTPYDSQGECRTWNNLTGECTAIPTRAGPFCAVWSTKAESVALGGLMARVEIWERQNSGWTVKITLESKFRSFRGFRHLAFSKDGQFLAGGCEFTISVWNTENGTLTWGMDCPTGHMNKIALSPDATRIISGSWRQAIKIWDLSKVAESRPIPHYPENFHFSDGTHFMAYYPSANEIRVWGEANHAPKTFHAEDVSAIALSPDNQRLASATWSGTTITIWDIQAGAVVRQFDGHIDQTFADLQNTPGNDCRQSDSDISAITSVQSRSRDSDPYVQALAYANNHQLASTIPGLTKIWNAFNGTCVQSLHHCDRSISLMTFSKEGRWLAYLSYDDGEENDVIKLWDITTGQCISASSVGTHTLSFSADSQLLAASTYTWTSTRKSLATINVWDVSSGNILRRFESDKHGSLHARFDSNIQHRLHTEHGFFDMSTPSEEYNPDTREKEYDRSDLEDTRTLGRLERMPPFHGYGLSYDMEWVSLNGKRLIWIPEDFRFPNGRRDTMDLFSKTQSPLQTWLKAGAANGN